MKTAVFPVLASLVLLPAAVGGQSGQTTPPALDRGDTPERVEILSVLHQYYQDLSARSWEGFAGHFWEGATITTVWQAPGEESARVAVSSVPEFVSQADSGPGSMPIFEETMGSSKILIYQNLALVWAEYSARFGEPGAIQEWSGIDGFTLMKHNGAWKIVSLAFSAEE